MPARDQPQTSYLQPSPQPNSAQRPRETLYRVWSPEGREELHTASNARDLVKLDGWHARQPGQAELAPAPAPIAPEVQADHVASSRGHLAKVAVSRLKPLRAEAEALGVEVDNRWGVKRLEQEIATKKAVAST